MMVGVTHYFVVYLLGRSESSDLLVIGGLRYERTDNTLNGFTAAVDGDENVSVTPLNFERVYEHFLPSFNIRYAAQDDLILRLAGHRSLVRPNFEQLASRVELNEDNEAVIGNRVGPRCFDRILHDRQQSDHGGFLLQGLG